MAARPATRANTKTKARRPRTKTAKIVPTDGTRATLEKASAFIAMLGSSKIKRGRPPAINARPGKAQNRPYQMAARPATRANTKTKTRRPRTITAKIVPTDGIRATLEKASAFIARLGSSKIKRARPRVRIAHKDIFLLPRQKGALSGTNV